MPSTKIATLKARIPCLHPQRALFQERVAAELKNLPRGMIGPGTLHRIIAMCQQTLLSAGAVAVGPSPKHGGKPNAVAARARPKRAC